MKGISVAAWTCGTLWGIIKAPQHGEVRRRAGKRLGTGFRSVGRQAFGGGGFCGVRLVHVQFRQAYLAALLEELDAQPVGSDGLKRPHALDEAVAGKLTDTCEAEQKGQREALERSLTKDEERIDVLEKMVLRLYEDMVAGRISEANFNLLMEKTQAEQAELKAKVEEGRKKLADEIRLACDARQWVEAIQEYADITELDAATLNRLIKEIVVHESIDSDKTRHISIEIHFNLKPIPEVEQVTA